MRPAIPNLLLASLLLARTFVFFGAASLKVDKRAGVGSQFLVRALNNEQNVVQMEPEGVGKRQKTGGRVDGRRVEPDPTFDTIFGSMLKHLGSHYRPLP